MKMEKWQLAEIISGGSKRNLILPTNKQNKTPRSKKPSQGKNKITTLLQALLRKTAEVIALF